MTTVIKRIMLTLLFAIILLFLVGCNTALEGTHDDGTFTIVDSGNSSYLILRHKKTGVLYLYVREGYRGGITVMLNADGTPMVVEDGE